MIREILPIEGFIFENSLVHIWKVFESILPNETSWDSNFAVQNSFHDATDHFIGGSTVVTS